MVWAPITYDQKVDIKVIHGTMKSMVANSFLTPWWHSCMTILMLHSSTKIDARQDRSRITTHMQEPYTIESLDWPSEGPGLNAIDHVSDIIGKRIYRRVQPVANPRKACKAVCTSFVFLPEVLDGCHMRRRRCSFCRSTWSCLFFTSEVRALPLLSIVFLCVWTLNFVSVILVLFFFFHANLLDKHTHVV